MSPNEGGSLRTQVWPGVRLLARRPHRRNTTDYLLITMVLSGTCDRTPSGVAPSIQLTVLAPGENDQLAAGRITEVARLF